MRVDEIRKHVRRSPFQPFRLFLSNGKAYDVRHPEMIYLSRNEIVVATKLGDNEINEESVYCDPLHVNSIEPINGRSN